MNMPTVDSGLYSTGTSEVMDNDVRIVVDNSEVDHDADDGSTTGSVCNKRNESPANYLQVPSSNSKSMNNKGCNLQTHHRGSMTSLAVDVFTPENITTVLRLRLVATLNVIICILLLLFVAPIVWYNVDRPLTELKGFDSFTFENILNCTEMPNATTLLSTCDINTTEYQDCEFDSTIMGLYLVQYAGMILNSSTQCLTNDTRSFFCNATLLLCNGNSSSVDLTEECEEVRDNKCASEWRIVESICNIPVLNCSSYSEDEKLTFSKAPNRTCPPGFDHFDGSICSLRCGQDYFSIEDSPIGYVPVILLICAIIGLIGGFINLIVYYYRRKKLFHFPQIYIVHSTVSWMIFWCFIVVRNIAELFGALLMCSDSESRISMDKPTLFCTFQGFMIQFMFLCFLGFWCFHLLHLFLGLTFPFKTKLWLESSSRRIKIHFTEVVIVILIGLTFPIITVSTVGYEDNGLYCGSSSLSLDFQFYGDLLPEIVMFCVGLFLLFTSFWILRKKHHLKSNNITVSKVFCLGCSVAEGKLSILFCYNSLVILSYFIARMIILTTTDTSFSNFVKFLSCSAGGERDECKRHINTAVQTLATGYAFFTVAIILFSFINLAHFMYIVSFQAVKIAVKNLLK